MNVGDAMRWLDERGGRWCVRATGAGCRVVATVGAASVTAVAGRLDLASVQRALVDAVATLCAGASAA